MAKKRKEVNKIEFEYLNTVRSDKPKCFGEKCAYCLRDVCGKEWFDLCSTLIVEESEGVL